MHLRAPSRLEEPLLKGLFRAENKQHNPQPLAPLWEPNNPLFETLNDELDRALEVTKLKKKQRP